MPVYVIFSSEAIAENDRRRPSAGRCRSTRYETGPSSASRIFSHAEARRARREEDWIFSAAPRLRVNLGIPLLHNISFLHRCRGFLSASRIFSHAEARRARREEDWILSACSAAPREPRVCLLKRRSERRSAPRANKKIVQAEARAGRVWRFRVTVAVGCEAWPVVARGFFTPVLLSPSLLIWVCSRNQTR